MMPKVEATLIKSVVKSDVTEDGKHVLLDLTTADGKTTTLAFPESSVLHLIQVIVSAGGKAQRILRKDEEFSHVFSPKKWNVGLLPDKSTVALSFVLEGGAQLSFGLPHEPAKRFLEVMAEAVRRGSETQSKSKGRH